MLYRTPQVAECLIQGAVPDEWDSVWEGPSDVHKWLSAMCVPPAHWAVLQKPLYRHTNTD